MSARNGPLLKAEGLAKRFGGIVALADYSIEIRQGELLGLIGPNGAGKTTVFNLLSGVLQPTRGRIFFEGFDVTRRRPDQSAAAGIARTFQNIRLFNELSVVDNIKIAFHHRTGCGLWSTLTHSGSFRRAEREMTRRASEFIDLLGLAAFQSEAAKNLPYGVQRRVEIARAMATSPKLLFLDEPAAGLNRNETRDLIDIINRIHTDYGLTVFLVEHDMKFVMAMCRRIQVLDRGRVLTTGLPEAIRRDPRVIEAYLGKPKERHRAQGR